MPAKSRGSGPANRRSHGLAGVEETGPRAYIRGSSTVAVAQLVRAPDCGSGGRGFKSHQPPLMSNAAVLAGLQGPGVSSCARGALHGRSVSIQGHPAALSTSTRRACSDEKPSCSRLCDRGCERCGGGSAAADRVALVRASHLLSVFLAGDHRHGSLGWLPRTPGCALGLGIAPLVYFRLHQDGQFVFSAVNATIAFLSFTVGGTILVWLIRSAQVARETAEDHAEEVVRRHKLLEEEIANRQAAERAAARSPARA